jgi:hypothetical protein
LHVHGRGASLAHPTWLAPRLTWQHA